MLALQRLFSGEIRSDPVALVAPIRSSELHRCRITGRACLILQGFLLAKKSSFEIPRPPGRRDKHTRRFVMRTLALNYFW